MTFLVTGASGLLGATLSIVLRREGHTVFGTDRKTFDLQDDKSVSSWTSPSSGKIDVLIHTAAETDVALCERDKELCLSVNADGTRRVCSLAKRLGAHLLYVSTASVFSGKKGNYKANDTPEPVHWYDHSKALGEKEALRYDKGYVVRLNLIGIHPNGSRGKNFFEWLYDSIMANADMKLFSDVRINPLSNWTTASFLLRIADAAKPPRVLHFGTSDVVSKADIGLCLINRLGNFKGNAHVISVDQVSAVRRPKEMWLNTDASARALGVTMPTVAEEIDTIFRHLIHSDEHTAHIV